MNDKHSGVIPAVVAGLIIAGGDWMLHRVTDDSTAVKLAGLQADVAALTQQVGELTKQPYIRRDEFESRLSGFDQRIGYFERAQQFGGERDRKGR